MAALMPSDGDRIGATWHYPALVGCIGADRPSRRSEVRRVARRIWEEALRHRANRAPGGSSFAIRRALVRATHAALGGTNVKGAGKRIL